MAQVTGRCMKCKEQRTVESTDSTVMKNGAIRAWGPCPECGSSVNVMMSKAKAVDAGITVE